MAWIVIAGFSLVGLVAVSYLVEALRPRPTPPDRFPWAPDIPVRYVELDDVRLRYLVTGTGPPLVLLHTLRTQLDMFQKVIPTLARRFTVYALDHPGHGFSDIPDAEYTAELFVRTAGQVLDRLDLQDVVLVGESIGGSVALILAARQHPRVSRVVAINPYDYGGGNGLRRSSLLANVILGLNDVPVLGATVNRLRQYPIIKAIFDGGVRRKGAMPAGLALEMYRVGNRRGHLRAFMSLVSHWRSWEAARSEYGHINRPVLLIYGEHDWSYEAERQADARDIPRAEVRVVRNAGHFLALDAPEELVSLIVGWAPAGRERPGA